MLYVVCLLDGDWEAELFEALQKVEMPTATPNWVEMFYINATCRSHWMKIISASVRIALDWAVTFATSFKLSQFAQNFSVWP